MKNFLIFLILIITGIILFVIFIPERELVFTKEELILNNNGIETNLKTLTPIMVEKIETKMNGKHIAMLILKKC